jgi:hypothetical protein
MVPEIEALAAWANTGETEARSTPVKRTTVFSMARTYR